ncbi:MAG: sigma-70 family RNA polymerase sigma factor [Actinomycetota bacterium]
MNGIRSRSETAFATAYEHTADHLASFANGMVHDAGFSEDAVQQAFLELVKAAPTIKGDGRALRAWLFRSVRFTCLDELRRRSRRPEHLAPEVPDVGVEPEIPPGFDIDSDLAEAMGELTHDQQTLLVLRHVVGMDGNEIARIVGRNRPAVYAATRRAEQRLRTLLERAGEGSSP